YAPSGGFSLGVQYPLSIGVGNFFLVNIPELLSNPNNSLGPWLVQFVSFGADVNAAPITFGLSVPITPPGITSATGLEVPGSRLQQVLQNNQPGGALTCAVKITPTLNFNPGGSTGVQWVTIWETHDWGDGRGQVTTWKGWHPVTGTSSDLLLA